MKGALLRSLAFFWPKANLNLLFLVDEEVAERDNFTKSLKNTTAPISSSVSVAFNSIDSRLYKNGHDRQQLIMFWADNFTNAEYVGFLDDDTLFTHQVLYEDLFDNEGRPHVIGRSNWRWDSYWKQTEITTEWIYGEEEVMRTMTHFPVIVKTSHLKCIREAMLSHHPEFHCFDDLFSALCRRGSYSQFNLMHQYLWYHKNDEYAWSLEATSANDEHFRDHVAAFNETEAEALTRPIPRCALHVNYDKRNKDPAKFVEDVFRRGFCYSLTREDFNHSNYESICANAGYGWDAVSTTPNTDQWLFEGYDWRWDGRCVEAHRQRHELNRKKPDWDQDVLAKIFRPVG